MPLMLFIRPLLDHSSAQSTVSWCLPAVHPDLRVLQAASPLQDADTSSTDTVSSSRSPVASPKQALSVAPFRLKDAAVRRPSVGISNGQMSVFGPPATPEAGPAAIASAPDLLPFSTPDKDAEEGLDYDELDEGQEMCKLQRHYRASTALADISNRESADGNLTAKRRVPPLDLSGITQKVVQIRKASAQLSRPHKSLIQENEAKAIC